MPSLCRRHSFAHFTKHIIIYRKNPNFAATSTSHGLAGQGQLQGSVVNTRHVACAGWLVLLGLQAERVHVDTSLGHILVVLIWLYQVEVTAIALGEAVVTVQLQLSESHRVGAVLERHWHIHVVGTTSGHTGHGSGIAITGGQQRSTAVVEGVVSGSQLVADVQVVGVVEPLLATAGEGGRGINVGIGLHNPHEFLHGVVEVQLNLVAGGAGALITSELQLLDQVFVGHLSETATLISVQVDVVNEQAGCAQGANGHSRQVGSPNAGSIIGTSPVAVSHVTELKVYLDLMILQGNQRQSKTGIAVPLSMSSNMVGLYLKQEHFPTQNHLVSEPIILATDCPINAEFQPYPSG